MTSETKPKKRQRHADRVTLKEDALARVDGWLSQLAPHLRGVRITRSDLVHWVLVHKDSALSGEEVSQLEAKYFDLAKALAGASAKAKVAQTAGETLNPSAFIDSTVLTPVHKSKRPRLARMAKSKVNGSSAVNPSESGPFQSFGNAGKTAISVAPQ